jgi:adenosine deaminase
LYSVLHCHFESALRALALVRPDRLRHLRTVYDSSDYVHATPAGKLTLLWQNVLALTEDEDIFGEDTFRQVARRLLDDMRASCIEHIDLRIGPSTGRWGWMRSASDGLDIFREELARYPELSLAFLAGVNMTKPQDQLDAIFDSLSDGGDVAERIVGVDINFLTDDLSKFNRYQRTLRMLQGGGLKINIHLGELFDNEISRHVLSCITPDRIGHGVLLLWDEELVDIVRSHAICLDMCPTSNIMLGVADWNQHSPARRALRLGIPVTINTDDPILFGTTIEQEFRQAGLTDEELDAVGAYARKYRYGDS